MTEEQSYGDKPNPLRDQFETWAEGKYWLGRSRGSGYIHSETKAAWEAWQAAISKAAQNWTAEKTEDGYILVEPSGEGHLVYDYGQSSDLLARLCQWLVDTGIQDATAAKMTSPTPSPISDQAAGEPAQFHEAPVKLVCDMLNAWIQGIPYIKVPSELQCRLNALLCSTAPTTGSAPANFDCAALTIADELFPIGEPPSHAVVNEFARRIAALITAPPANAPAATRTMPPLNEAMRQVLRNQHAVHASEDALYEALAIAANAPAAIVLTNEQILDAIKDVCNFDGAHVSKWRGEALLIGRAVEYASRQANARGASVPLAFESALTELVNKIDTGLDSGDLLIDARRASDALDAILTKGDLVANAYDYFRELPGHYENSREFRIGWNACLDAIGAARAALATASTTGSAPETIRFDFINADGNEDSKVISHDEMRERYASMYLSAHSNFAATASPAASVLSDDVIWNIGAMNGIDRLTELLDDDQWNEVEPLLMKFARALLAASTDGNKS